MASTSEGISIYRDEQKNKAHLEPDNCSAGNPSTGTLYMHKTSLHKLLGLPDQGRLNLCRLNKWTPHSSSFLPSLPQAPWEELAARVACVLRDVCPPHLLFSFLTCSLEVSNCLSAPHRAGGAARPHTAIGFFGSSADWHLDC